MWLEILNLKRAKYIFFYLNLLPFLRFMKNNPNRIFFCYEHNRNKQTTLFTGFMEGEQVESRKYTVVVQSVTVR